MCKICLVWPRHVVQRKRKAWKLSQIFNDVARLTINVVVRCAGFNDLRYIQVYRENISMIFYLMLFIAFQLEFEGQRIRYQRLEIHLQRRPRFSTGFIKVCTNARSLQTMPRTLVLRYSCQLAAFRGTRRVACNERVSRTRKYLHVTGLPTRVKFLWNVPGLALIVSVLTTKPNLSVNGLVSRRKPAWTLIKGDSTSTVILDLCWHTGRGKRLWSFKNV